MNSENGVYRWDSEILASSRTLIPESLSRAAKYLVRSRRPRDWGWGAYPGTDPDLHCTAAVSEALSAVGKLDYRGVLADVTLKLRRRHEKNLDAIGCEDLSDLVRVFASVQDADLELLETIGAGLRDRIYAHEREGIPVPLAVFARTATALSQANGPMSELVRYLLEKITSRHNSVDGGWSAVPDGLTSPLVTSLAVRACAQCDMPDALAAARSGSAALLALVSDSEGWTGFAEEYNTLTLAETIRALTSVSGVPYSSYQEGIGALVALQDEETAGWRPAQGGGANIENTATALAALIAVGEGEYVPSKLAIQVAKDAAEELERIEARRRQLSEELESRVQAECGQVVDELKSCDERLKQTRSRQRRLKEELERVRDRESVMSPRIMEEIAHRARSLAMRFPHRDRELVLFAQFGIAAVAGAAVYFVLSRMSLPPYVTISAGIASAAAAVTFEYYTIFRQRRWMREAVRELSDWSYTVLERAGPEFVTDSPSELLDAILNAMSELAPPAREAFAYELYRFVDMPRDIASRRAEEIVYRFPVKPVSARRLTILIRNLSRLEPNAQRALLERLRELVLE